MNPKTPKPAFEIRPLGRNDAVKVLDVYRRCEDFLALGPEPHVSLAKVLQDMEASQHDGGFGWIRVIGSL